tara:strand:+ start:80209 stop:81162 length:954 start_codon:yes stop_codon:yes gene_type:complete
MKIFLKIFVFFIFSCSLSSFLSIEKESIYDFIDGLEPVVDFNKVNEDINFFIDDNLYSNNGYHLLSKSGEEYIEKNSDSGYFYSYHTFYGSQDVTRHVFTKEYEGFSKRFLFYTTPFDSKRINSFQFGKERMLVLGGQVKTIYQDKTLMSKSIPFLNTAEYKKIKYKNDIDNSHGEEDYFLFRHKPNLFEDPYNGQTFNYSKSDNTLTFNFFNGYETKSDSYYNDRLEKKYTISKGIIWSFFLLFSIFFISRNRNETKASIKKHNKIFESNIFLAFLFKSRKHKKDLFEKNSKEIEKLSAKKKEIVNKEKSYDIENE